MAANWSGRSLIYNRNLKSWRKEREIIYIEYQFFVGFGPVVIVATKDFGTWAKGR